MLTGIHVLLTYQCTGECDHCFLHCSPQCEGTFTLQQIRALLYEIRKIGTVDTVYFEGGEPFLYYALLLESLRLVRAAGLNAGIVTNGYWATCEQDAELWLRPLVELGICDFSVSDDEFHSSKGETSPGAIAYRAAEKLGLPADRICIEAPQAICGACPQQNEPDPHKGQPVIGGGVLFKGRAAEKLTAGLPLRDWRQLTTCPHEELAEPERVHVDCYGNVHVCQGLSIGNMWQMPLAQLLREYQPERHPIIGPLIRGGPAQLVREFRLEAGEGHVDECHLCYTARKALLPRFPQLLAPEAVYGVAR